jgi:hypothetical protein
MESLPMGPVVPMMYTVILIKLYKTRRVQTKLLVSNLQGRRRFFPTTRQEDEAVNV